MGWLLGEGCLHSSGIPCVNNNKSIEISCVPMFKCIFRKSKYEKNNCDMVVLTDLNFAF